MPYLGNSKIIWESWHICAASDLSHDLHKSCMYDQCKHKAFFAAIHMFCAFDIRARAQKESNLVVQDR